MSRTTRAGSSRDAGIRALDQLRDGVQGAIEALGRGFLRQRDNRALHEALQSGELDAPEYYRQLLRLVYRLIFLFVAEERDALLDPTAPAEARERYRRSCSALRLRALAERRRGNRHADLWRGLRLVMEQLGKGCPELGLPALGSFLWSPGAIAGLAQAELADEDLLAAVRSLCLVQEGGSRRLVSWQSIGAAELGSVYESLLELHPKLDREAGSFELHTAAGHERKSTGSYYTPTALVDCLLDSALEPLLAEAARQPSAEQAILDLKVCDPACGSGHFLVAAARRIARKLASVRCGDEEPSPESFQAALRDVVGRCIYGVDLDPMAVELAKVSLWMEAIEPGKPLSFLDAHLRCGNSLFGATPALMAGGIPDEAFEPTTGEDRDVARRLKKRNREARRGQITLDGAGLLVDGEATPRAPELPSASGVLAPETGADDTRAARLLADAWCAAFFWPKQAGAAEQAAITDDQFARLKRDPSSIARSTIRLVDDLAARWHFFHWPWAFPGVFPPEAPAHEPAGHPGRTGFDCILGNPPYGKLPSDGEPGHSLIQHRYAGDWDLTNLANLFFPVGIAALRDGGRLGFVFPKSLSYVESYQRTRDSLHARTRVLQLTDAGRAFAFADVGLEQLLIVLQKTSHTPGTGGYEACALESGVLRPIAEVGDDLVQQLGMWPIYLDVANRRLLSALLARSRPLRSYCAQDDGGRPRIFRGLGFQSKTRYHASPDEEGALPLLGGRNITSYWTWHFAQEPFKLCRTRHPDLVGSTIIQRQRIRRIGCKNVVSSDVKIEATLLGEGVLTLDTINNVVLDPALDVPLEYVIAVLNSEASSWYLREVLFNRAQLTMHLDEHYLGSVPIPVWTGAPWQVQITALSRQLLARPANKFGKGVTDLEEVQHGLREQIERLLVQGLELEEHLAAPWFERFRTGDDPAHRGIGQSRSGG